LHKGKIAERGSHDQLLQIDGLYNRLYQLQYKDQQAGQEAAT
jgi:ATP-binding cassette, subfamily B, multidrug efflux pump